MMQQLQTKKQTMNEVVPEKMQNERNQTFFLISQKDFTAIFFNG